MVAVASSALHAVGAIAFAKPRSAASAVARKEEHMRVRGGQGRTRLGTRKAKADKAVATAGSKSGGSSGLGKATPLLVGDDSNAPAVVGAEMVSVPQDSGGEAMEAV